MVIIMYAIEEENHRNIVLGEVVVIRTVVETVRIVFSIITIIQNQVGVRDVVVFIDLLQVGRQHFRTYHIHVIFVFGILIFIVNPAYHINIDIVNRIFQRKYWVLGIILRSQKPLFFTRNIEEQHTAAWSSSFFSCRSKGFGDFHHPHCARTVVIRSINYFALTANVDIVVVGGDYQFFLFLVSNFQKAHYVFFLHYFSLFHFFESSFLGRKGRWVIFGSLFQVAD